MYTKRFTWFIHNDDNRAEDGRELRYEFCEIFDIDEGDHTLWMELDCSFLEMLIALARRIAFQTEPEYSVQEWFWKFMDNLELRKYTDDVYHSAIAEQVEDVLDRVITRRYSEDGLGGLFPLRNPHRDQRTVELWSQMMAYLLESEYVNNTPS